MTERYKFHKKIYLCSYRVGEKTHQFRQKLFAEICERIGCKMSDSTLARSIYRGMEADPNLKNKIVDATIEFIKEDRNVY